MVAAAYAAVFVAAMATVVPAPSVAAASGDPLIAQQWSLSLIGAPARWPRSRGAGVTVAILDSGVDGTQENLRGAVKASGSCVGAADNGSRGTPATGDDDGHGTHVGGIVAARAGNGVGGVGVAPAASL